METKKWIVRSLSAEDIAMVVAVNSANPTHNLWLNNGTWFFCATLHVNRGRCKDRLRASLHTKDLLIAQLIRDDILAGRVELERLLPSWFNEKHGRTPLLERTAPDSNLMLRRSSEDQEPSHNDRAVA